MEKFSAERFIEIGKYLGMMAEMLEFGALRDRLDEYTTPDELKPQIERILNLCVELDLRTSGRYARHFIAQIEANNVRYQKGHRLIEELTRIIQFEMETVLFFHVPSSQAEFYHKPDLFGRVFSERFPNLQSDMEEAGNCLALGQGTACVFHLMRIMEAAVQEFGRALGIGSVETTNWQIILDQINKAIKALPSKGQITAALSEAATNLYSVKLAWRNEVMHPKATYTEKEAEDVLRQVRLFMQTLAERLPAPASTSTTIM